MSLTAACFPEEIVPENLDEYLSKGWFRMGQSIFTTNFLTFNHKQYNAVWLRIDLNAIEFKSKHQKLLNKIREFEVEITTATIDQEKEELYYKYKEGIKFQPTRDLQTLLFDNSLFNIFNSHEITIRHQNKLIACGIFDLGKNSAQGIISFYDPGYKSLSLGKVLFLKKMQFLKSKGYEYFFPGYFVPGYAPFDYKLDIAPEYTEYYDIKENNWFPIKAFNEQNLPLRKIDIHLTKLSTELHRLGVENQPYIYDLYDVKMIREYSSYPLLDYPRFLLLPSMREHEEWTVIFNVFKDQFEFWINKKIFQTNLDYRENHYNKFIIQPIKLLFSGNNINEFLKNWIHFFY